MSHRGLVLGLLCWAHAAVAQQWNDDPARRLVGRAVAVRRASIADSTLESYRATAHGFVTFLAEFETGIGSAPRVVKGDELLAEVYWRRPDWSKQVIRAWRDSTFLPSDLSYHRDHLGIVSDDFGATIRIGEGDEVADVAHPFSAAGVDLYDFRLGDTVRIAAAGTRVTLVAVVARPRDPDQPRVIGTFYLDAERAVVVRSELSFTAAAYRDRDLEDITVRLERALVEGRYWLPWRQEIEIRRRSAIVDFPLRGVIRGRWEIDDYTLNEAIPAAVLAPGPAIGGLRQPGGPPWSGPLRVAADSALRPVDRDAVAQVRAAAAATVRRRAIDGLPSGRLAVSRFSDIARVNRVEGLRLGLGLAWRGGPLDRVTVRAGYGTADHRVTGAVEAERSFGAVTVGVVAEGAVADFADEPVVSPLVNSLAAQEGGRDLGDYLLRERVGLVARWGSGGAAFRVGLHREEASSVVVRATPARGSYRPNPALGGPGHWVGRVAIDRARSRLAGTSSRLGMSAEAGAGQTEYGRISLHGEVAVPIGGTELGVRGQVGGGTARTPASRGFAIGGTGTLPGEAFRGFGGRRAGWGTVEWLVPVPGPSLGFGLLGRTGGRIHLGPFLGAGWADGAIPGLPWQPSDGVRPVAGVAVELFDRLIRLEVGQRMREGGGPTLSVDVGRAWWPIL